MNNATEDRENFIKRLETFLELDVFVPEWMRKKIESNTISSPFKQSICLVVSISNPHESKGGEGLGLGRKWQGWQTWHRHKSSMMGPKSWPTDMFISCAEWIVGFSEQDHLWCAKGNRKNSLKRRVRSNSGGKPGWQMIISPIQNLVGDICNSYPRDHNNDLRCVGTVKKGRKPALLYLLSNDVRVVGRFNLEGAIVGPEVYRI